jgi:hypothetical protein
VHSSSFDRLTASNTVGRGLELVRLRGPVEHRPPSSPRLVIAAIGSLVGSLVACAALVALGQGLFPSTHGYAHFRFSDYGPLATVGVLAACIAWPVVTKLSSAPRWLFYRSAIAVSVVLLLPDFYLLAKNQPAKAVAVLMMMHLAIAVVTYNLLVRAAPIRPARHAAGFLSPSTGAITADDAP